MKKIIFTIFLAISIGSCERDDICIDAITPKLVVRFYDNDAQTEFKNASLLSVKIIGIENDSITLSSTNSIAIPLKVVDNTTQYVLTINNDDGSINRDTVTVNYTAEEVFVGRSCGFKSVFNAVDYQFTNDGNNWIKNLEVVTDTIINETAAHVKIFH